MRLVHFSSKSVPTTKMVYPCLLFATNTKERCWILELQYLMLNPKYNVLTHKKIFVSYL